MAKIKIRAKVKGGVADIKCLITHPMDTGLQKNKKTGKKIPPHFIQDLTVAINGKNAIDGAINTTVSKNPYFRFHIKASKGDKITVAWKDNKGKTASKSAKAK